MRIAAIDFGMKRIGIALSDERGYLASPKERLSTKPTLQETAEALICALKPYMPLKCLLLGLPLHMNGKESELCTPIRALGALLEERLCIPILYWDERLTSMQVERTLKEMQLSRKKRTPLVDSCSAALILQSFLDHQCLQNV